MKTKLIMKNFTPFLFLLFLNLQVSNAATYYVSTTGNNNSAGSNSAPWKTVTYGVSKLVAGDILRIKAGTYIETAKINITKSNVTIVADDPTNRPTIDFQDRTNTRSRYVASYGCSGVTWDGVNIINAGGNEKGAIAFDGTSVTKKITGWTIKNCDITYAFNAAIRWQYADNILIENVYASQCAQMNVDRKNTNNHPHIILGFWSNNVIQRNCRVIQNHGEGMGPYVDCSNWIIENCTVADNYKINIYVDTEVGNCIVRNNLIYTTAYYVVGGTTDQRSSGVRIANEISDFVGWGGVSDPTKFLVQNVDVYNNIILNCRTGIEIFPYNNGPFTLTNSTISNNTIVGTTEGTSGVYIKVPGAVELRNNIVYNTNGVSYGLGVTASNNKTTNPLFVVGTGIVPENYKLANGSPCINAGYTITKVTTDFWGTARPYGATYDIGAHESTIVTSIIPVEGLCSVKTYPNPVIDILNINWDENLENTTIFLFDITGKQIYIQKVDRNVNQFSINFKELKLKQGIYFLKLISDQEESTIKIVKK